MIDIIIKLSYKFQLVSNLNLRKEVAQCSDFMADK